jgi:hypothetical protein
MRFARQPKWADRPLSNAITGITGCCARAASGHAAAVPPRATRNFRLAMLIAIGPFRQRQTCWLFRFNVDLLLDDDWECESER